jgi:hypothetical protein
MDSSWALAAELNIMATELLAIELATYDRHKAELVGSHEGKFVLIHGEEIAGIWDTYQDALAAGYKQFGLQPFFVKQILAIERVQFFTRDLSLPHADLGTAP